MSRYRIQVNIFIALFCGLMTLLGCSQNQTPEKIKIGFLVKQPEEPWFQNEWKFAEKAAKEAGFDLIKIGATDGEKVLSAIDNLAAQGAQGFVICTPDVKLGPAIMARAQAANMKVFSVDDQFVGADGNFMDVPYMGISARDIGRTVGSSLYQEFLKRGFTLEETAACAMTYDELDTSRERTNGAIEALSEAGFPTDRIFKGPMKTTDVPGAFDAANVLLTQHPEIKHWLVFSLNDEGVMGAVRAMEGRGFSASDVIGIGIGGTSALVEFQKENPTGFHATVLISPYRHGYETSMLLYKWIREGVVPPMKTLTSGILIDRSNYQEIMKKEGLLE